PRSSLVSGTLGSWKSRVAGGRVAGHFRETVPPPASRYLKINRPRRAWERNGVADVRDPRLIHDDALEAEAEAGVRDGAVAAQVAIPAVRLRRQSHLHDAAVENLQSLFALAAADD